MRIFLAIQISAFLIEIDCSKRSVPVGKNLQALESRVPELFPWDFKRLQRLE
jgi:hypothetical protein